MVKVVPCEVYSRVVGYYRPVQNWNTGKKQEFRDRVEYSEQVSLTHVKQEQTVVPIIGGGTEVIDDYKIFTFPHCDKCENVKSFLKTTALTGAVIDLKTPEGNKEFRQYYADKSIRESIVRLDDGSLKLPVVFFMSRGSIVSTVQDVEQAKNILSCIKPNKFEVNDDVGLILRSQKS